MISNEVPIRLYSTRTVNKPLLSSHTEVFVVYKWLMFGVTSTTEKYQKIIRDMFRGFREVENIVDDPITHGKGVEVHDRCLFAVLDRPSEVGLV